MALTPQDNWTLAVPSLAQQITITIEKADLSWTTKKPTGEFEVKGRQFPVIRQGKRTGRKGSIPIHCRTMLEYTNLKTVIESTRKLLLTPPTGEQIWVVVTDIDDTWKGAHSVGPDLYRVVTIALTETSPEV